MPFILRFALAFVSALALGTCQPSGFESLGAAYHSPHFDYLYHPDDPTVCEGVMTSLEQHETLLANYLDIDESTVPRVTYWKLQDEGEYVARGTAGRDALANADADFVVSPVPFDEHELTHTITLGAWGTDVPRFLEEGIAVAMSCDPSASEVTMAPYTHWGTQELFPYETDSPIHAALGYSQAPTIAQLWDVDREGGGYAAAGAVTTYLLDSAGADKFHQLWASTNSGATEGEFSATVKSIYGFSLEDAWQTLTTTRHRPCVPAWLCSLPAITNNERGTLFSSCTGKDLGRPTSGNLRLQYPGFTSDVYQWAIVDSTPPVSGISLIPCSGDPVNYLPSDPLVMHRDYQADVWIPPLAVPHVVTLQTCAWVIGNLQSIYNTHDGQIAYSTSPLVPTATQCSGAVANVIPLYTASALYLPNDGQTHFARYQLQTDPSYPSAQPFPDVDLYDNPSQQSPPENVTVELCAGCDGDDGKDCFGCGFGVTDCVVKFSNRTSSPLWLRIVNQGIWSGEWYSPILYADLDASTDGAVSDSDAGADGSYQ
jgi:hypothetical protein